MNQSGRPYQVYTAFLRNLLHVTDPATPLSPPRKLRAPQPWPQSASLNSLQLLPKVRWDQGLEANWTPGEAAALAHLKRFCDRELADYRQARDLPARMGTSRLSPHLHFGEIGPRQIWHALGPGRRGSVFLKELVWREFAHHLLHHFPHTVDEPLRPEFRQFPWRRNSRLTAAWRKGATGIPLVDAGMRELWATGWMHNRVRMVTASFLVKNLLVPWQEGSRWFWDTLVDADLANNTLNWQWVAGCGADAAPYFRIFNPVTQARRFDPEGGYIHRWVPELAPSAATSRAQPGLFDSYPSPIVDLQASRAAALDAYQQMRRV
jgi:deoxyribodipyrimidine photo-lyase